MIKPTLSKIFQALADERRRQIFSQLTRNGEMRVGDFVAITKMSSSTLSFHIKILHEAGLIRRRPDNRGIISANIDGMDPAMSWLYETIKQMDSA